MIGGSCPGATALVGVSRPHLHHGVSTGVLLVSGATASLTVGEVAEIFPVRRDHSPPHGVTVVLRLATLRTGGGGGLQSAV